MPSYKNTDVAVESSQAEIRRLLQRFGAEAFGFSEERLPDGLRLAAIRFIHDDHTVLVRVPLKDPTTEALEAKIRRARTRTAEEIIDNAYEQENRRIWRVLYWSLKARVEAIEEGIEEFEEAFLPHLVDPVTGTTLWSRIKPLVSLGAFRRGGTGLAALPAGDIEEGEIVS